MVVVVVAAAAAAAAVVVAMAVLVVVLAAVVVAAAAVVQLTETLGHERASSVRHQHGRVMPRPICVESVRAEMRQSPHLLVH